VLALTPSSAARSFACGIRSPGPASPSAMARRIAPATCSCSSVGSLRSSRSSPRSTSAEDSSRGLKELMKTIIVASMPTLTESDTSLEAPLSPRHAHLFEALKLLFKEAKQRERRRRLRWLTLFVAVIVTAGVASGIAYASASSSANNAHGSPVALAASTDATVVTCGGSAVARPRTFIVTCADGYTQLTDTQWTKWTSTSAVGTTTFAMNFCTPYCAASKMSYFPHSTVQFSSPVSTKRGRVFSLLVVHYVSAGHARVFRFSYKGDPSLN
jgi:hypothetical protein